MQLFTRQAGEGVLIGDDIIVTVVMVEAPYVTLGITTPNIQPEYRELTIRCEEAESAHFAEEVASAG